MLLILFKRIIGKSAASWKQATEPKLEAEQCVLRIQQGDEELREQFIAQYHPYIAKLASRFCKKYIDPSKDDEFSIALFAFNEAIDQYDLQGGASFLGFSKTVIQRRLIDHARKEQRHRQNVPYSAFDSEKEDGATYNSVEVRQAMDAHEQSRTVQGRRAEIEDLNKALHAFGITFLELAEQSPKHADSRKMLIGIAHLLAADDKLLATLKETGKLPVKELTLQCGVSRKTIERNRKYIIAIAIIIDGAYPYMNDYLKLPADQPHNREEVSS